jgi:hypothetical protein
MQQQIQFEATPFQHTIRIPDYIPDGVSVQITLSFDDTKNRLQNIQKFAKLKLTPPEINNKKSEYQTMAVDEIEIQRRAALAHIAEIQADWQGKPIENRDALYDNARD